MTHENIKDFRIKAEKELSLKKAGITDASPKDTEKFFPELRVDQIEPEMQNEELRKAQEPSGGKEVLPLKRGNNRGNIKVPAGIGPEWF